MDKIGIGLAGFGTVAAGVYKNLAHNRALLMERTGVELGVKRVVLRDRNKPRTIPVPWEITSLRWEDLIEDPQVQVIVELMGGIEIPYTLIKAALNAGKIVVTGNKALLAEHGRELFSLAREKRVPIFYEAAVAGGIPIVKAVREAFVANHLQSMHGIINGTCNYILTRMQESGMGFREALQEAQQQGYAEADPTLDINGWDAAHKAIILASMAYGFWVGTEEILVEGIERVTADDISFADQLGYTIKLLASIKAESTDAIEVRVQPTLIPKSHVLASVKGVFNAIAVRGDIVGDALFYGRGAGQDPTASAVISDIVEAAYSVGSPRRCCGFTPHALYGSCKRIENTVAPYYLRLQVVDRPGVLAQVATILAKCDIGISSVIQPESQELEATPLVLMIHDASYAQMQQAVSQISKLECMKAQPTLFPVETFASPS